MKKSIKYFGLSLLLLLGLTIGQIGEASEINRDATVQIELYKLLFAEDELPEELENNGQTNPFEAPNSGLLKKYRGLNGVTYNAYDVTTDFYELLKSGKSTVEAQQVLSKKDMESMTAVQTSVTETVREQDGVAVFQLPTFDSNNRYQAYLFKEVSGSPYYQAPSAQLVVILPVFGKDGKQLEIIKLFPKQLGRKYTPPTLTKDISQHQASYGETINYELVSKVPGDVWTYDTYVIKDQADERLNLHQDSLKVLVNGKELLSESRKIKVDNKGFEIHFDPMLLQKYAGEELTIKYDMNIKEGAEADTAFINTASLKTDKDFIEREQWVKTGGFRFIKQDRKEPLKRLEGATFVIKNQKNNYLKQNNGKWQWETVTDNIAKNYLKYDLFTVTSDKTGVFQLTGLAYGKYELVEVKAPEDYILSETTIPFEIEEGTWKIAEKLVGPLVVVNERIPNKTEVPPGPTPLLPPKKPVLPQTGEAANPSYLVGLIIIFSVISWSVFVKYQSFKERGE
ncbi:MAG: pilin N-terminal domain-containing protein [Vagococcus salmoninarum]|uniref:pilin N-terminal domain-containing protein n=1 Tax=Vagococcus salmoninarum TaxID=2739 RepID=UPI003F9E9874